MRTEDILKSLAVCGGKTKNCVGCEIEKETFPDCYDRLKLLAANEIAVLRSENEYLRKGNAAND